MTLFVFNELIPLSAHWRHVTPAGWVGRPCPLLVAAGTAPSPPPCSTGLMCAGVFSIVTCSHGWTQSSELYSTKCWIDDSFHYKSVLVWPPTMKVHQVSPSSSQEVFYCVFQKCLSKSQFNYSLYYHSYFILYTAWESLFLLFKLTSLQFGNVKKHLMQL